MCVSGCGRRSLPAPRERHEQQQQREDLQTAEQHADHEHDLAQRREDGKASGRSDKGEPRPDVGQARERGGEIRREVQPVERHDQPCDEQDDDVEIMQTEETAPMIDMDAAAEKIISIDKYKAV